MQLPFFFEENISLHASSFILSEETSKHCIQVLRMKEKEQLQLTNGKGNLFTATIINANKKNCEVKIEETKNKKRQTPNEKQKTRNISLAVSLLKNNTRFEWLLEKATETGIQEIIPLLCKRTERAHFRMGRMKNILVSAMLQSRQTFLPLLHEPTAFEKIISSSNHEQKFIAHCIDEEKKELKEYKLEENILMLIGPEGDFNEEEIQFALQHNFLPVSLGNTRLRSETAAIVAAALLVNS